MSFIINPYAYGGAPAATWNSTVAALPGLWGWWKLDEVAGAAVSAPDSSGNARNGTYTAAGTQTTGLFSGSTVAQATIGGRISLPSFPLPATPVFTIGAMVRTSAAGGTEQNILSADEGTARRWQMNKNITTNAVSFVTILPSVTTTTGATAINNGVSHLVIVVFDQTLAAASGRVKIYVDGVLDGASTTAITLSSAVTTFPALGSRNNVGNVGLWQGALDEGFICNAAISSTDVANLWAARNI